MNRPLNDLDRAIDDGTSRIVDDVLWYLGDETLDRGRVEEIIDECVGNGTEAVGAFV